MPQAPDLRLNAKSKDELGVVYYRILDSMRGSYSTNTINLFIIFTSYVLYKLINSDYKGVLVFDLIYTVDLGIEPSILQAMNNSSFSKEAFEKIVEGLSSVNTEGLREIVERFAIKGHIHGSGYRADHSTPDQIVRLASRILNVQEDDNVADICSGNGDFLCGEIKKRPKANYVGYEIEMISVAISKIRADMLGHKLAMETGDAIINLEKNPNAKFDKIFCNYPFGLRIFGDTQPNVKYAHLQKNNRGDWLFNTLLCNHLTKSGKGVSIMTAGSLWNAIDKEARKYFIDNGLIEAIISLPAGAFSPMTGIDTSVVIFSNNNKSVRFINVSNYNSFTDSRNDDEHMRLARYEIDKIMSLMHEDRDGVSFNVDNEIIKDSDYNLSFKAYYSDLPKYENGIKIKNVAEILRGTINTKNTTEAETDNYILKLSDLQGALVSDNLGFISDEDAAKGFRLEPGDIIISRTLNPIKVAIFDGSSKKNIYPSGNLFVLRTKHAVDPYYLLSFLLSEEGKKALEFAATGTTLKVLSATSLENIIFPDPKLSDQEQISANLRAALMEISTYEYKLTQAKDKLKNSFYERSGR